MLLCEVPPGLLQLPATEAVDAIAAFCQGLSVLGSHCLGLLLPVDEHAADISVIVSRLQSPFALCIELAAGVSADKVKSVQKVCAQQGVGVCWHGQGEATGLSYGPLALTRIDSKGMNMRQLRQIVETILITTTLEQSSILIFDGQPPDVGTMRNAGVILDLI